jgi:hypothetical protein
MADASAAVHAAMIRQVAEAHTAFVALGTAQHQQHEPQFRLCNLLLGSQMLSSLESKSLRVRVPCRNLEGGTGLHTTAASVTLHTREGLQIHVQREADPWTITSVVISNVPAAITRLQLLLTLAPLLKSSAGTVSEVSLLEGDHSSAAAIAAAPAMSTLGMSLAL